MQFVGIKTNELTALGLLEYSTARSKLATDLSTGNFPAELQAILDNLPKDKQLEIMSQEALIVAVAKMIEANNQALVEQFQSLGVIQK
ncbi:hypothetical protein [Bacillus cereus]|uniref:hypothetical protein n=1 Tax=Bacillus sp. GMa5/1 TaxID=3418496 RepID=UPI002DBEEF1D|nr:hypothetical protein [Bacillus cereus]